VRVELHPEAETELFEAAAWYDDQDVGLGDEVLLEATRWLAVIADAPLIWPVWPGVPGVNPPIRKLILSRFPYAIAYQVDSDRVLVLAFAHTSRQPLYWENRAEP